MSRTARKAPGGMVYHVINPGVGRQTLFHKHEDYAAFERVMAEAYQRLPTRILSYCLMPNHWHFVVSPKEEGADISNRVLFVLFVLRPVCFAQGAGLLPSPARAARMTT